VSSDDSFTIPLTNCARCGRNHERVEFRKFKVPCADWTHWGFCPNTGEPILLQYDGPILLTTGATRVK
jgi:hypothetical protein